jgi:hypothetical protein
MLPYFMNAGKRKDSAMFDAHDSFSQEFESNQFIAPAASDSAAAELQNFVTLIGNEYGLEVEWSGFVSVDREVSEAEAFLARLYAQG